MRLAVTVAIIALGALPAHATDGVIEINQAKALAGGVTSCDGPGLPVSICASGSYRLTSDLTQPVDDRAISILANDVTLDLNGMAVRGPNLCQGSPYVTNCTIRFGAVLIDGNQTLRTTVVNGTVLGGGGSGMYLGDDATVRDVRTSGNGSGGLFAGHRSTVARVSALSNLFHGVYCRNGCSVRDVVSIGNGGMGFSCEDTCTVDGVTMRENSQGAVCQAQCVMRGASVARSGGAGIVLGKGSQLSGFSSSENAAAGVVAADGSMVSFGAVRDNGASDSTAYGLLGSGGASYHGVVITASAGGNPATASGMVNLGANSCQGGACP